MELIDYEIIYFLINIKKKTFFNNHLYKHLSDVNGDYIHAKKDHRI